ncbi:hypothetical protein C5167_018140 [Papaver somniferum]|uniref:Uncharacterized protein n=1 Tax=Papaver somniferum TaxID=3469 RepID=A0A4Y7INN3_PAPSO|nr:hypothetical protein C5167_018140 [Papaver somniferum]
MADKEMDGAKSYARRDKLMEIERNVQTWWDESDMSRIFIVEAHSHCCLSTIERCQDTFAFWFLLYWMPNKASADKLAWEIVRSGNPPVFLLKEDNIITKVSEPEVDTSGKTEWINSKAKVQAASKSGGLRSISLVVYFPHVAKEDLKAFGLGCGWQRSFITTDIMIHLLVSNHTVFVKWRNKEMDGAKSYSRRDELLEIERNVQSWCLGQNLVKSLQNINGLLHLGHAFSLSKLEFAAAYRRLRGAKLPIFGNPPVFALKEDHIINKVSEPEVDTRTTLLTKYQNQKLIQVEKLNWTNSKAKSPSCVKIGW